MKNPGQHLITDFKQGNKAAFEAVYDTYRSQLYYFIKRIVEERQEAEDIAAETFIKLWKLRANFETHQNIKAFLFVTARNACLDYLRSVERKSSSQQALQYILSQDSDVTLSQDEIQAEVLKRIHNEIENLPPKCRQIFKMAYLKGLKNEEIAGQLQLSYQTVKNQKVRAIKLLRIALNYMEVLLLFVLYFIILK